MACSAPRRGGGPGPRAEREMLPQLLAGLALPRLSNLLRLQRSLRHRNQPGADHGPATCASSPDGCGTGRTCAAGHIDLPIVPRAGPPGFGKASTGGWGTGRRPADGAARRPRFRERAKRAITCCTRFLELGAPPDRPGRILACSGKWPEWTAPLVRLSRRTHGSSTDGDLAESPIAMARGLIRSLMNGKGGGGQAISFL